MNKLTLIIICITCVAPAVISAQITPPASLTTLGSPYTQDFNTLSNTAGSTTNTLSIMGWGLTESGGGARDNEQYAVDNGSSTTGDMYSYGTAATTDRALGSLRSGTLIPVFGASFTNNTGSTITSLDITYTGEEWRLGTVARTDQLDFQYSLNATDLVTGTWTDFDALDFVTPNTVTAGAKDGNNATNRTLKSATITGLSIANGATFLIRWNDVDASGADDGLSVDDFSLTPQAAPAGPVISGKLTDVISIDNYAPNIANPTDEITYKNTIKNTGNVTATGVTLTENTPTNTTLVPGSEVTSALARNDSYTTSFNTALTGGNVVTNDYGLPSVSVVTFGTVASLGTTTPAGSAGTTTAGGTLTVNSNGTFSYTPPIAFSGTDQFMYIATTGVAGLPNNDAVVSITVNADITFSTTLVNPLCNGGTTGSITFTTVSGGSGSGYTYSITGTAGTYFASPVFTGLVAGTYNLAVKDGAGYFKTGTATLTDPPLLSFTHMDVNNVCNGGTAGSITFTATGGTGTITYSITGSAGTYQASNVFNGLASATYNLAVKDANGCIATGTATLTEPAAVTFTFTKTDITCFGLNDGSIVFNTTTGGTSPYNYSIGGTGGTFQASTTFTGLTPGIKSLVAKDVNGCNSAATSSTIIEPTLLVVSGTIPNLVYNIAMATATFTKTGGTGSPANPWSATGLPAGISINTSNGQVTGTPTVTGVFNATVTYMDANGCTDDQNITFNVAPNLGNNTYAGIVGNTQMVSDGHSTPLTPFTTSSVNILTNDSPAGITITAVTNVATTAGGSITIGTDGKFTYTPPTGSTAADTYVYTGTSNGVSATATLNFTIANMVWYVNNTYAGANGASDGRSHRPFTDVASAEAASAINQTIYVHTGLGITPGNALLKSGQTLRGAGNALTIGALTIAAGTKPTLSGMITLANSVTVDGFDMNTGATTAITSSGATGVTVSIGNVTTSGAANAVTLTNTTGSVIIAGGTLTGGAGAVFNVSGGTATITCAAAINQATTGQRLINIQTVTGGSVTLSGSLSSTGTSTGINVSSCTGGTVTFSGATKTMNTPGVTPVTLASNTGATVNFTNGGLVITSTTATGFNATGGATAITVQGTGNTITSTTGTGLNVANTTIGVGNLNFQSIASSGSVNGIVLNNTGSSGGLTVAGNGGGSNDGSGGTIQNTTGNCILITNSKNVNLNYMNISNAGSGFDCVKITTIDGLTFNHCNINDASGVSQDRGIEIGDFSTGTSVNGMINITNTVFSQTVHDNLAVGASSGTSTWNVTGSTFQNSGNIGFNLEFRNATTMTLTFSSCTFTGVFPNTSEGIHMQPAGAGTNGTLTATIQNCNFADHAAAMDLNCDISATTTYKVLNNTIINPNRRATASSGTGNTASHAINFFQATTSLSGALLNLRLEGNIIGNSLLAGSGSSIGNGVRINFNGNGQGRVLLDNNTIRECPIGRGIEIIGRNGTGQLDVTLTNNNINHVNATFDVSNGSNFPLAAIMTQVNQVGTAGYLLRANILNNTVPAGSAFDFGAGFLHLQQTQQTGTTTLQLVDAPPASANASAELGSHNTGSVSTGGTVSLIAGPINLPPP